MKESSHLITQTLPKAPFNERHNTPRSFGRATVVLAVSPRPRQKQLPHVLPKLFVHTSPAKTAARSLLYNPARGDLTFSEHESAAAIASIAVCRKGKNTEMGRGLPDEASTENGGSDQNWGLLRGGQRRTRSRRARNAHWEGLRS